MKLPWRARGNRERELADELEAHFRLAVEDRMARGATREEALAAARREFGNEAIVREATRQMWFGGRSWALARELRISLRTLARTPGFSVAAVLCICVGIGATIAIFSVLHATLLRPLPYPNAGDVVTIHAFHQAGGRTGMTREQFDAWQGLRSVEEIGTWRAGNYDLTGAEDLPVRAAGAGTSPNLFSILGVRPLHGRWFERDEDSAGASNVVILGYGLWRSRFGGDPALIDTAIRIGDRQYTVVGVMPEGFSFPDGAEIWSPLVAPQFPPDSHILFYDGVIGRLSPRSTLAQARAEFSVLMNAFRTVHAYEGWGFDLTALREHLTSDLRRPIFLLQGAALLVLLIGCANVAALLLARGATRRRELAIRAAVGADAGRLARHVFIECGALATIGGLLGIGAALGALRLLPVAFPDGVPSFIDLSLHPPVVAATLLLTVLVAIGFGCLPALGAVRTSPNSIALREHGGSGGRFLDQGRARRMLVVGEIAASVLLLALAVALVRAQFGLEKGLGFRAAGLLTFHVPLPPSRYPLDDDAARAAFSDQLRASIAAVPGVESVNASVRAVPLDEGMITPDLTFRFEHQVLPADASQVAVQTAATHYATPSYLRALGVPLLRGRHLTAADVGAAESVAVVNETFAHRYFPGGDAVGRRIFVDSEPGAPSTPVEIVGIVSDVRHLPPPADLPPALYMPFDGFGQTFILETSLRDPLTLAGPIRAALRDLDPMLVVDKLQTQDRVVARAFWRERLQRNVIGAFAGIALMLALFGMYGVLSYMVAERTPELGIRHALGASTPALLSLVLTNAVRLAAAGIAIGLLASLASMRLLRGVLWGMGAADPLTLAGVAVTVLLVTIAAALIPARRAIRLAPLAAIRDGSA